MVRKQPLGRKHPTQTPTSCKPVYTVTALMRRWFRDQQATGQGRGRAGQGRAGQGRAGVGFALKRSSIIWAQRRAVTGVLCSRLGLQFTSISHTFRAWSTTKSYPNSSWLLGRACRLSCTTEPPTSSQLRCCQALNCQDTHCVKHDLTSVLQLV